MEAGFEDQNLPEGIMINASRLGGRKAYVVELRIETESLKIMK